MTNTKNYKDIPLYRENHETAMEHGEATLWRDSYHANIDCAKAISDAINNSYSDNRLDSQKALNTVLENFNLDRIAFVAANDVNIRAEWDMRFAPEVKAWANQHCSDASPDNFMEHALLSSTHSGLVNLFTKQVAETLDRQFNKEVDDAVAEDVQREMTQETETHLYEKIKNEYDVFISDIKKENADTIVASAYEIVIKDNITNYCQETKLDLQPQQLNALLSSNNTLDAVYEQWCQNGELHSFDDVGVALKDTADRIQISLDRENDLER